MSKTLEKRLKTLELKNGRIVISEPMFTPAEEAAFREVAVQAVAENWFKYEVKKEPSLVELEDFKSYVRTVMKGNGDRKR